LRDSWISVNAIHLFEAHARLPKKKNISANSLAGIDDILAGLEESLILNLSPQNKNNPPFMA